MAVEIPVYVDIEGAFKRAAQDVPDAMKSFQSAVDKNQIDLFPHIEKSLENVKAAQTAINELSTALKGLMSAKEASFFAPFDPEKAERVTQALMKAQVALNGNFGISQFVDGLTRADFELLQMREHYTALEESSRRMSTSINGYRERLQNLNEQWNNLTASEKFASNGKMTAEAKRIYENFKKETLELIRQGQTLDQIFQKEQNISRAVQETTKRRQYESAVLNSTGNTMHKLQEQARVLQERLERARFGTKVYDELKQKLEDVRLKMQALTNGMKTQSSVFRQLTSMASTYISVFGVLRLAKQLRDVTGELEYQRVALGRLIQDEEYGAALFEKIKIAAQQSPFRITQLVTYTKQLAAYRIEQENLYDTTMRLADISAGLGVDMNRLILAYGQVRAASVLRGQELRQFTEAGIPLVELLTEKMGELNKTTYSTADIFKLISERAVPFSAIASIFEDLTEKGGMFYKMQEKQADTIKGKWEKLKDAFDIGLQAAGETKTFQWQNQLALNILTVLAKNIRIVPKLVEMMGFAWATYNAAVAITAIRNKQVAKSTIDVMTAQQLMGAGVSKTAIRLLGYERTTRLVTKANAALAASNGILSKTFARLTLAMLSNPYAAVAAAVIGVASAFLFWRKQTDAVSESVASLDNTIEKFNAEQKEANKIDKLIEQYKELSNKTNRSEKETERLAKTIKTLQDRFPGLTLSVNDDTKAIEANTSAMTKNNDARKKASRDRAEADLAVAKAQLSQFEEERDKAEKAYLKKRSIMALYEDELGQPKETLSDKQLKTYQRLTDEAAKLKAPVDELDDKIQDTSHDIIRLNELLYGGAKKTTKAWREQLQTMQVASNGAQIFTNEQLDGWNRLYDVSNDLEKEWKKLKEDLHALRSSSSGVDPKFADEWAKDIENLESKLKGLELIREFFGFVWGKSTSRGARQTDPFVTRMQERIKFMQDFKKGYDDLSKYMAKAGALEKEGGIMLGRGMSLGLSAADQRRAAEDLSNWYAEMIEVVSGKLKAKGVSGTSVTDLLGIDTTKLGKDIQDLQKLLQSLWDAKTDFDTSQMKKSIEDALKKLSEEIKRSETARNFYQDILGLTGDEQLAASMSVSVYGGIGDEFKERMQQQLNGALNSLKVDKNFRVTDDIQKAFDDLDFQKILAIKDLPENVEKVVREAYEASQKYDADLLKNFASLISKYGDTAQKVATIRAKAENEINKVKEALKLSLQNTKLTPEERKALQKRADEIIKALEGQRDLDEFKAGEDYVKFFSEINIMTAEQAAVVRGKLRDAYLKAFHDGAISADELRRNLRAVDEQFKKLSESTTLLGSYLSGGFDAANAKLQEYADNVGVLAEKMKSGKDLDQAEQAFATRMLKMFGGDEVKNVKSYEDLIKAFSSSGGLKEAGSAFGQMGKGMSAMAAKGPGALAIVDAIFQAVHSTITSIQQMIDELNRMRSEENKVGEWFKYVSDFDKYTYSGWEKLKSGDVIGATADAVSSWVSIFNNIQEDKVKKINEDIKEQGKLLDDLQYSYERLGNAIEKSFGSEYVYNFQKQLENLQAQAEAYRKQAELERGKGKSAEEDVAKDYEKQARDIEDQIADMRSQLSEFFSGTDLTSAAEDFANAWIDAYKEFGSTTDAMSEKFNEMIQNMINRSLAAKIMQEMLQPIFDQIDTMASDGLLATEEIAAIAALAQERIPLINDAMTNLMTSLASAGLDVRASTAGFHGISKDIAGASEESILGLAAAINTQNFYISYVPTISENVSQILAAMTGGVSPTAPVETNEAGEVLPSVQRMVYDHLPNMDANLSEMLRLFRSVITTKTGSTNTNYVAIK